MSAALFPDDPDELAAELAELERREGPSAAAEPVKPRLVSIKQGAELLGKSRSTIYSHFAAGRLRPIKGNGGRTFVDVDELTALAEAESADGAPKRAFGAPAAATRRDDEGGDPVVSLLEQVVTELRALKRAVQTRSLG